MAKKKNAKEKAMQEKWRSYTGTGISATKGKVALVLRQSIDGKEYAIVKLSLGCRTDSPMKVIEEIKTDNLSEAENRFNEVVMEQGFKLKPLRTVGLLFK